MRIAILGAGRVGAAMARDLATSQHDLVLIDGAEASLDALADLDAVRRRVDLTVPGALEQAVDDAQIAIGAVPGPMGFDVARRVLEAGKHLVDISFFEQDAFTLDGLARERGLVCCVDSGIAPGVSNLVIGRAEALLARVDRFICYVGGLPVERRLPWEYSAPFSPIDVFAEYTRPARSLEGGEVVERPALSSAELVDFPGLGTLEAFETDGLRTLLHTSRVPHVVEKTLRYPGHRERIELLRDIGLFGEEPVELADGTSVRPIDVAAALLFPQWRPAQRDGRAEDDLIVMRCRAEGVDADGVSVHWTVDLVDRADADTGTSAMARCTGYTCTAITRCVADGAWSRPGVVAPETLGADESLYARILGDLESRGIQIRETHAPAEA